MSELLEPFARMLDQVLDPAAVRALEAGGPADAPWHALATSGFLDALVAEEHGGAGLSLAELMPLVFALGARAVPLPVAETMVARALLAEAGVAAPEGPIALSTAPGWPVPGAFLADHVLVDNGAGVALATAVGAPTGVTGSCAAWPSGAAPGLRPIAAVLRAGLIAGAAERLTEMSTTYANERAQFGKPIGRQQAVQHMLAVMAEDMIACRLAAQMGAAQGLHGPLAAMATAKIITATAAARIANSAHAVHGAIGIAAEYDLNLLTRRLHEWRLADGSEGYWAGVLGAARLGSDLATVDWVREAVF